MRYLVKGVHAVPKMQIYAIGHTLTLDGYQREAMKTCLPSAFNEEYLVKNLAAEVGEVCGKFAKKTRDGVLDEEGAVNELGDVLWQVAVLAEYMGYTLEQIGIVNLEKLRMRQEAGTLQGSGDKRRGIP